MVRPWGAILPARPASPSAHGPAVLVRPPGSPSAGKTMWFNHDLYKIDRQAASTKKIAAELLGENPMEAAAQATGERGRIVALAITIATKPIRPRTPGEGGPSITPALERDAAATWNSSPRHSVTSSLRWKRLSRVIWPPPASTSADRR